MHRRSLPEDQPAGASAHQKNRRIGFVISGIGRGHSPKRLRFADEVKVGTNRGPDISRLLNRQVQRPFEPGAAGGGIGLIAIDNTEFAKI